MSTIHSLFIVGVSLLMLAQNAQSQTRIEGLVLDGNTDKPLADVRISTIPASALVMTAAPRTATRGAPTVPASEAFMVTDAEGRFSIDVASTATRLQVTKDGYMAGRPDGRTSPENSGFPLPLATGQRGGERFVVRLFPSAIVTGIVRDHRGNPAAGAVIVPFVYHYNEAGGRFRRDISVTIRTNDRGEFRTGLDPGDYLLEIRPTSTEAGDPPGSMLSSIYYPGTTDPARAEVIHVAGGSETRLSPVSFTPVRATLLRVRVINESGARLIRTTVATFRKGDGTRLSARVNASANAESVDLPDLAHGAYIVAVDGTTDSRLRAYGMAEVDIRGGTATVEVRLKELLQETISGRAVATDGRPVAGVRFALYDSIDASFRGTPTQDFTTAPDGTFRSTQHSPSPPSSGFYRVRVLDTPPGSAVVAIHDGNRDVLKDGLQYESGELVNMVVRLEESASVFRGVIKDTKGRIVFGAAVVLVPDNTNRNPIVSGYANPEGAFTLQAAPGDYHLYAWRELVGAPWFDADFLKIYVPRAIPVRLGAGSQTVDITIPEP